MIKVNDVIDVRLRITLEDVPENLTEIDWSDYNKNYSFAFFLGDECLGGVDFDLEAGYSIDDEISEMIKEDFLKWFEEVSDFEIFDVESDDYEYQKAKVRIKALKEPVKK